MKKKTFTKNATRKENIKRRQLRQQVLDDFSYDEEEERLFEEMGDVDLEELEEIERLVEENHEQLLEAFNSMKCKPLDIRKVPSQESLIGKCLVHIGDTDNELYKQAVIYITECSPEEVRGVMINKLLFGTATLECKTKGSSVLRNVYEDLYQGGPENPAHGVVIFPTNESVNEDPYANVLGDVSVSSSFGVLQEIMDGAGPKRKIIAMGHCVWHRGELEWELFNNQWLIVNCSLELMFDAKFEDRWELAKQESGVYKGAYITSQIGLA